MVPVCVTGGSGYVASWLIKLLLERGYTVRATVRHPGNLEKTAHLQNLPHAHERLHLVKADLLDDGSFDAAVDGCEGVFHTASPVVMITKNPQEDLINPAVKGTLNVLNACAKSKSVKRVVLTSSVAAVFVNPSRKEDTIVDESLWSDQDCCKENNLWYYISKTLAEKTAWEFAKERGLDLVAVNPGMVLGRPLQPSLDTGSKTVLEVLTGAVSFFQGVAIPWVDVRDVAEAHLLAFEVPTASGRYLCTERVLDFPALLEVLQKIIPGLPLPPKYVDEPLPSVSIYKVSSEKLQGLGLTCRCFEDALKETVDCLIERGLYNS